MKKYTIYMVCFLLFLSCYSSKSSSIITVTTNLYDSFNIDSINHVFEKKQFPFTLNRDGEYVKLHINPYVVITECYGGAYLYSVTRTKDFYIFYIPEYIVGYDICLIYDKMHSTMYKTEEYNDESQTYKTLYDSIDLKNNTIDILYEDGKIDKIRFSICTTDTITL